MKMSKELKNIKNDLMINFNLKDIYEPPSDEYIKEVENPESDINFLSDNLGKIDLEFIEKNFKGEGNDN